MNLAFRQAVRRYHPDSSATPDEPKFQAAVDAHALLRGGQDDVDFWRDVVRELARASAAAVDVSAARARVAEEVRAGRFDPFAALGLSAAKRQPLAEVNRAFNKAVRVYDADASAAPDAAAAQFQAALDAHDLLRGGQDDVDFWRAVVRELASPPPPELARAAQRAPRAPRPPRDAAADARARKEAGELADKVFDSTEQILGTLWATGRATLGALSTELGKLQEEQAARAAAARAEAEADALAQLAAAVMSGGGGGGSGLAWDANAAWPARCARQGFGSWYDAGLRLTAAEAARPAAAADAAPAPADLCELEKALSAAKAAGLGADTPELVAANAALPAARAAAAAVAAEEARKAAELKAEQRRKEEEARAEIEAVKVRRTRARAESAGAARARRRPPTPPFSMNAAPRRSAIGRPARRVERARARAALLPARARARAVVRARRSRRT